MYHVGVPSITGGFTGVDIFFVISGFLIGGHIYSELRRGDFSYLRFYQHRAKRILPAFYAVLVFTMLAALFLLSSTEAKEFGRSAFAATLSTSNILFWRTTGYFNPTSEINPLLMTWSLGVEEQFYAVIPLLMVLLVRMRRSWLMPTVLAACTLSFLVSWRELNGHPIFVFYMLPARAWELGVGVALAIAELHRKRHMGSGKLVQVASLTGLASMLVPVFLVSSITPFPGVAALPSVLGAGLVLAAPASWINRRLLSTPPLVFVGRVSYSFYLWHWPLLAFVRVFYGEKLPPPISIVVVAAAFGAAVVSYFFIEQPLRKSRRAPAPLLLRYAAVSILILAACAIVWRSDGAPWRFPSLIRTEADIVKLNAERGDCILGDGIDSLFAEPNLHPDCEVGLGHGPSIAVWGDSHAAALAPGLRSAAIAQGYGFVALSRASCLPLVGTSVYNPREPQEEAGCFRFNRKVLNLLKFNQDIQIVVLVGFWESPFRPSMPWHGDNRWWLTSNSAKGHEIPALGGSRELLKQSLIATIQSLQEAGKEVIVFEDVPNFVFDPVLRTRTARIPARHALAVLLGALDASDPGFASPDLVPEAAVAISAVREAVADFPDVALVDLKSKMCRNASQCAYRDGDRLLYSDSHHITPDGAQYALRGFRLPTLAFANKYQQKVP
jgi:peptidoglycan/LPS O-acetylase OafA/YrhL